MRKLFGLLILVGLLLGAAVAPASAQSPMDAIMQLAGYFPEESIAFIAFRTDTGHLEALDGLLAKVQANLPPGIMPPVSIMQQLEQSIQQQYGADANYEGLIGNWLGDMGAVGLVSLDNLFDDDFSNDSEPSFIIALSITNRAAAEKFLLEQVIPGQTMFEKADQGRYTLLTVPGQPGVIAISDSMLLVGMSADDLHLDGDFAKLSNSADFTGTMSLLPEASYNIGVYLNLGDTIEKGLQRAQTEGQMDAAGMQAMSALAPLFAAFPRQAAGLTILDERSLVLDMAQTRIDPAALEAAGFAPTVNLGALDPAFATYIPAGTPLVFHSTNLRAVYEAFLANLKAAAQMSGDSGELSVQEIEQGLQMATLAVRGMTGLDLQTDIIDQMTGDYALYFTLNPAALEGATSMMDLARSMPIDFGLLFATANPGAAQKIVDGIETALTENQDQMPNITFDTADLGGSRALVITASAPDMPFPLEIVISGNDKLFVLGTRNAAMAALQPQNSITGDAAFQEAAGYLLPNPSTLIYFAGAGLMPLADLAAKDSSMGAEAAMFGPVLRLLSSSSISTSSDEQADYARLVLTLPQ